jgi:hypothetical protein
MIRRSLRDLHERGSIDSASGALTLYHPSLPPTPSKTVTLSDVPNNNNNNNNNNRNCRDGVSVAVTYFRAGYTPNDYPTQDEWQARELIERSNTVQVPWGALLILVFSYAKNK